MIIDSLFSKNVREIFQHLSQVKIPPYYIIILLLLCIVLLWFFFGNGNSEFIQLFNNNNLKHYIENESNQKESSTPSSVASTVSSADYDEFLDKNICINQIDKTPKLPDNLTSEVVFKRDAPSQRFESKGETLCRAALEKRYGVPFINIRPEWLKNPETNRCLELDCYNEKLKIAVEYNGIQHYVWPNGFTHQTYEDFVKQMYRDKIKQELCHEHGIHLIVVPYNVPPHLIESYILSKLPENN